MDESLDISIRLPKGTPTPEVVEALRDRCSLTPADIRRYAETGKPLLSCDDTYGEGIRKIIRLAHVLEEAGAMPLIAEFGKPSSVSSLKALLSLADDEEGSFAL